MGKSFGSLFFVVMVWNISCSHSESADVLAELARFCSKNGHKYVTIADYDEKDGIQSPYKTNSQLGITTTLVTSDQLNNINMDSVVIFVTKINSINVLLERVSKRKILKTILIIEETSIASLMSGLASLKSNSFFYVLSYNTNGKTKTADIWRQVMTLNNETQVISNELTFDMTGKIIEKYDMQGFQIVGTALSWAPYATVQNCNDIGRKCTSFGLLADLFDIWAKAYNFTWDIYADVNNNWGVNPVSGPYNVSGVWKGVMGDVVLGKYPLSISSWRWFLKRDPFLDFVPILKDKTVLAVIPKPPEVDPGLFIRPFRDDTWEGIGIMSVIGILILIIPWILIKDYFDMTASKIVMTSGWIFFVLINAYYGGALTMFFVSEITLPFNNIRDVLRAYPAWNLLYIDGNEAYFNLPAAQGDPDYVDYWNRVEASPDEYVVSGMGAGITKLQSGSYVLHATDGMLKGFFKSNPFNQPTIKVFGGSRSRFDCLELTKNSPLKPMFTNGMSKLLERGQYERLQLKWQGSGIQSAGAVDLMILSGGQVFLIFGELLCFTSLSLIFLAIECVAIRIKRKQFRHYTNQKANIIHEDRNYIF